MTAIGFTKFGSSQVHPGSAWPLGLQRKIYNRNDDGCEAATSGSRTLEKMEAPLAGSSGARKRILVADDDDDLCALLVAVLEPLCDLTIVHDAETALRYLEADERYDAIVSDFMLPGITGVELVARIRGTESQSRVPILMISGHGSLGIGKEAAAAGADAFLDKPFTLAQLRTAVSALLGRSHRFA